MVRTKRSANAFMGGRACGAPHGGHAPGHECVPHIVAEAWIAVVHKHPRAPEESILGIGGVSDELRAPGPLWLGGQAGDVDPARGQFDQHDYGEPSQAAWRPDLDREEVGRGEGVPVSAEKLTPRPAFRAHGGRF